MDSLKEQQVLELIKNRQDLDYVKIALFTGTNLTAVRNIARKHNAQRSRGRKTWKKVTPVTMPPATAQGK
jgi:hypothetical protein